MTDGGVEMVLGFISGVATGLILAPVVRQAIGFRGFGRRQLEQTASTLFPVRYQVY